MKIVQEANRSARDSARCTAAIIKRDSKRISEVVKALTRAGVNVINVYVDRHSYNLSITGPRADLDIMFGILRRAGLTPNNRPEEKSQHYTTYWVFPTGYGEQHVWISFTSTSCKRVQVRTEMQEVPVYETVCED
jgi:hypothetical protein